MSDRPLVVLKVGGRVGGTSGALQGIAAVLRPPARAGVCIVHGGGNEVTALLERLGQRARFKDGLRVTDGPALEAATMVLRGSVSTGLVRELARGRVRAVGLSGVDSGMVTARPHPDPELGAVGEVERIDPTLLHLLIAQGMVPLVAPIALDATGAIRNINGDTLCGALAAALGAAQAIFLTDVPGVKDADGVTIPRLTAGEAEALIEQGTIHGGMVPKIRACLTALDGGARSVCIADGRDERTLPAILDGEAIGTIITAG